MIYLKKDGTATTKLRWKAPVTRADLTLYTAEEHAGYELGISDGVTLPDAAHVSIPAAYHVMEWPLADLDLDLKSGVVSLYLRTVDTDGRVSDWSDPFEIEVDLAKPGKPLNLEAVSWRENTTTG